MAEKKHHVNASITNIWNRIKKTDSWGVLLNSTNYQRRIWRKVSVLYRENKINILQPNEPPTRFNIP